MSSKRYKGKREYVPGESASVRIPMHLSYDEDNPPKSWTTTFFLTHITVSNDEEEEIGRMGIGLSHVSVEYKGKVWQVRYQDMWKSLMRHLGEDHVEVPTEQLPTESEDNDENHE